MAMEKILGLQPDADDDIYEPGGCPQCDNTGYKGRIGVYEILEVTADIRRNITERASTEEIRKTALEGGMDTLRMEATRYVLEGITSFSEMTKVSFDI